MVFDLLTLGSFLLIAWTIFLVGHALLQPHRQRIRERLGYELAGGPSAVADDTFSTAMLESLAVQLPQWTSTEAKLAREVRRAGWYRPGAKTRFLALRNVLVILTLIGSGTAAVLVGPDRPWLVLQILIGGLAGASLCWGLPRIYLRTVGRRRVDRIRRGLPDALDLITMCLTGGLSLPQSLGHVSGEIELAHPDLAGELLIVRRQSAMRSFEAALAQWADRVDAPEIVSLAALITQGQRLGTDIVTSISDFADAMRLKRRQTADERSNKAGVKMLFPLTMCALPSAFIILWGPSVLELWKFLQSFEGVRALGQ